MNRTLLHACVGPFAPAPKPSFFGRFSSSSSPPPTSDKDKARLACVEYLLGADVQRCVKLVGEDEESNDEESVLRLTVQTHPPHTNSGCRLDLNAVDSAGHTVLHLAAANNDVELVALLLERRRLQREQQEQRQQGQGQGGQYPGLPLHRLNINEKVKSKQNREPWSALHLAAQAGHARMVALLLEHGARFFRCAL